MKNELFYPLSVRLIDPKVRRTLSVEERETGVFPAHENVIRPLLKCATEAYIYQGRKEPFFLYGKMQVPIDLSQEEILTKEKGKYRFDLTRECISGHEYLWGAIAWKRGSIVVILQPGTLDFGNILRHTFDPGLIENPNTWNNPAAAKLCKTVMEHGNIACIFSASNGIENMFIYARGEAWEDVIEMSNVQISKAAAEEVCLHQRE